MARQLRGQTLHETNNRAFRCAVVRVKGLAALARRGADGNNAATALRDHVRHGEVNYGVDALHVHAHHFVPLALCKLFDRSIGLIPDAGIGHKDVDPAQALPRKFHQFLGVGHFAEVGFE